MCFELAMGAERGPRKVGRSSHNALVINDATVSREHLLLHPTAEGQWLVEALPRASPVVLNSRKLEAEQRIALTPGARLGLGDVCLTFHDADTFHARLGRIAAEVAAREAARAS
jgi:hypothetical protein